MDEKKLREIEDKLQKLLRQNMNDNKTEATPLPLYCGAEVIRRRKGHSDKNIR